jgi:hypothetical protein
MTCRRFESHGPGGLMDPQAAQVLYLKSDICRRDLLVGIEALGS